MPNTVLRHLLSGRRYLLLQGPMGPFFSQLAQWLRQNSREVWQVNFNGGDRFYNHGPFSINYHGTLTGFSPWLRDLHLQIPFDTLICFGDCRPLHQEARRWAKARNIRLLVLEDGYLRPHFITLEENGVNGNSSLSRDPAYYLAQNPVERSVIHFKPSFSRRVWHAIVYYLVAWLARCHFPYYQHHKPLNPWKETFYWLRAAQRKLLYRLLQYPVKKRITRELKERYFLAILQVHNDSQILYHSPYKLIEEYIRQVIISFAKKASKEHFLLIKHHPMDRGHCHYGKLIQILAKKYAITGRVIYIHDIAMPLLLTHARGVVTINSTAGLSALHHNQPLKVMGTALYDIRGITYQGSLNNFWHTDFKPDTRLFKHFRSYLCNTTQLNTVYYGKDNWFAQQKKLTAEKETAVELITDMAEKSL